VGPDLLRHPGTGRPQLPAPSHHGGSMYQHQCARAILPVASYLVPGSVEPTAVARKWTRGGSISAGPVVGGTRLASGSTWD